MTRVKSFLIFEISVKENKKYGLRCGQRCQLQGTMNGALVNKVVKKKISFAALREFDVR